MTLNVHKMNPEKAKDCLIRADLKAKSGDLNGALSAVRECLEHHPNNTDAHILAARIYLKAKKADTAIKVLNQLKQFQPPSETSLLIRAKAEYLQEKYKECIATLDEIFASHRDNDEALEVLADCFLYTGKAAESITIYERLLEKDKSNRNILYSLAYAFYLIKEWEEVIHYCAALVETGGGHPAIQDLYDKALQHKKDVVVSRQGHPSFLQRIFAAIFDPITEKQLRIQSDSERQVRRASHKTYTDANTGALNYRAMVDYVPNYFMTAKLDVYITQMDIDHFKAFNDKYSHQVGDEVLRSIAASGKQFFPDRFFRKGGEEFLWVFEGEEKQAVEKAEEWRVHVEQNIVQDVNERIVKGNLHDKTGELFKVEGSVTISQGIAKYRTDGDTLETLLQIADHNLYEAKESGRNVVVYKGKLAH